MMDLIWKPAAADSEFVILARSSISFIGKWLWLTANTANPNTVLSHADNLTRQAKTATTLAMSTYMQYCANSQ